MLTGEGKWLEAASTGLGAPVPAQVADKLRGRTFRNFDHFREAFWLAVAACPELMGQFKPVNIDRMKCVKAPQSIIPEQAGKRKSVELHHIKHIDLHKET